MQVALSMVLALAMILFGAELFTNAVEWLGVKLHLGQGAVGSVLAALGTALPETAVPVTAILLGGGSKDAHDIGIGGILGAPFLLVTLGSLIMAVSLFIFRRSQGKAQLQIPSRPFQRDMAFFISAYAFAILVGCLNIPWLHHAAPWVLVFAYILFVVFTLRDKAQTSSDEGLHPLYLQSKAARPSTTAVVFQLLCALAAIVGGAQLLTSGVQVLARWWLIPPFVLSAVLIPLTTELPETFNSVVWIRQGKDALAVGNITGAMVFQSTLVPALGILLTPWSFNPEAMLTGGLTLAAACLLYGMHRLQREISPSILVSASILYWILPVQVIASRYHMSALYWLSAGLVLVIVVVTARTSLTPKRA